MGKWGCAILFLVIGYAIGIYFPSVGNSLKAKI